MNISIKILEMFIGFSSGVMIGAAFIALLTVLGVIPRLVQLGKVKKHINLLGMATILGTLFGTFLSFTNQAQQIHISFVIVWGFVQGMFNGMVAAALAEILNVFPILTKRMGLEKYLYFLLMAVVFGKIFGSLFQWLILME